MPIKDICKKKKDKYCLYPVTYHYAYLWNKKNLFCHCNVSFVSCGLNEKITEWMNPPCIFLFFSFLFLLSTSLSPALLSIENSQSVAVTTTKWESEYDGRELGDERECMRARRCCFCCWNKRRKKRHTYNVMKKRKRNLCFFFLYILF